MSERPDLLFVSGAHKSGTTWVQRLLNSHPEVGIVGEAGMIGDANAPESWLDVDAFRRWAEAPGRSKHWLQGLEEAEVVLAMQRALMETLILLRHGRDGVRIAGDKSPAVYCLQAERLHALFPHAFFVDVVRDGRDVAVSHMFHMLNLEIGFAAGDDSSALRQIRNWHLFGRGKARRLFRGKYLRRFATRWRRCVEGGEQARELFQERYHRVRYEDLLTRPHEELGRLFEFLGVACNRAGLEHIIEQKSFAKQSGRSPGDSDPTSFFRKGVAGDWRNHFTDRDVEIFDSVAGETLRRLGYVESVAAPIHDDPDRASERPA